MVFESTALPCALPFANSVVLRDLLQYIVPCHLHPRQNS